MKSLAWIVYRICVALMAVMLAAIILQPFAIALTDGWAAAAVGRYFEILLYLSPVLIFPGALYVLLSPFYISNYVREDRRSLLFELFSIVPTLLTGLALNQIVVI